VVTGVALAWSELPLELIEHHDLARRAVDRGGEREVQFLWSDAERLVPVWHGDALKLVTWGNRRGESRVLPCTGWTWQESVGGRRWEYHCPEAVDIPATMLRDGVVWYCVRQGVRGLLVRDEQGVERVFGIAEPASYYYRIMTKGRWMPVLIGERI
jgi:hypothetical protein